MSSLAGTWGNVTKKNIDLEQGVKYNEEMYVTSAALSYSLQSCKVDKTADNKHAKFVSSAPSSKYAPSLCFSLLIETYPPSPKPTEKFAEHWNGRLGVHTYDAIIATCSLRSTTSKLLFYYIILHLVSHCIPPTTSSSSNRRINLTYARQTPDW